MEYRFNALDRDGQVIPLTTGRTTTESLDRALDRPETPYGFVKREATYPFREVERTTFDSTAVNTNHH